MAYTHIAVGLDPEQPIATADYQHTTDSALRVVTLSWGNLTIHIGGVDDTRVAESLDHLHAAVSELRCAAHARLDAETARIESDHDAWVAEGERRAAEVDEAAVEALA